MRCCPTFATARRKVFAKVETLLIDHALGLRLAARVVVRGVVESAVAAYMKRAAASFAFIAKAHPLDDLGRPAAMPTVHVMRIAATARLIESATLVAPMRGVAFTLHA